MSSPGITFGPVPSRRLGRSLGVNNLTSRCCTYACAYCQVRHKPTKRIHRSQFHDPRDLVAAVTARVRELQRGEEPLDFITFVPDGEPALDVHLGEEIEQLRHLGVPLAVISNGALLWRRDVRESFGKADWISLKVDTVDKREWRRINRPHPSLHLDEILGGMCECAADFDGQLTTETMLLAGLNDGEESVAATARFLEALQPSTAYLAIPTRPTTESWAEPASAASVIRAHQVFADRLPRVELLTGSEGDAFGMTGDLEADLIGITAVHPMRRGAIHVLLARTGADWSVVEGLLRRGMMTEIEYQGEKFYVRCFSEPGKPQRRATNMRCPRSQ